ncbi:MAG: efflux RND transporter periplasmic adaptor subunit [Gammaproteobacteria bacterium]|uniref:Co/Zn/Cd efflux system membrane fusion protein n=1 Tax=Marinobacter nitratireducens TaxID=1137280 RepID=A0A072N1E6_9GAMM|nr:efflux RND transporter periplasmic adaptor subunit [Marinobacter nitratireducens]KEF30758.1 Putative Co/Zn/Cd efflux system membrane fusion protein [Marinobacter nitratireducens]TNE73179.1 MAG: efflux RND transporter periplasmic adaptor subunit [Gammaproteobacteria bacterium]TNE93867.1 MAG: efflux RND transporter periplasmic adaptor subunit [Gammaproteobacteria bacterium]
MRTASRFVIVIIFLGIVLGGIFGYKIYQFGQFQKQMSQPQPPAQISATRATTEQWTPSIKAVGSIEAVNGIEIANEVAGVVEEINFESGDRVKQGDVLIRIDSAIDEAALRTRRAEAQLAQQEFKRVSDLLPKRAVSQSQYDEAKANYDAAKARVNEAEAQLSKKIIRAPFDGTLGIRMVDQGEYIATGTSIVEVNMLDPIYVDYTLSEKNLPNVATGYPVAVTVAAVPDQQFEGSVSAINTSVNPETRTVRIRATLENPKGLLRPGMFATIQTQQPQDNEVVTVPRTAVSFNTYGDFVFVVADNDEGQQVVNRRTIVSGETRNGRVAVMSGLEAGETVVAKGLLRLRAGQSVVIQEGDEQSQEDSE